MKRIIQILFVLLFVLGDKYCIAQETEVNVLYNKKPDLQVEVIPMN